jgi:hypothetical protein
METVQFRTGAGALLAFATACSAALVLPACTKPTPLTSSTDTTQSSAATAARTHELNWAREALQRNPTIEVVATDTSAGVFTIRSKDTGEVHAVKLSELAAAPIASLTPAPTTAATSETATPAAQPEEPVARAEPAPKPHSTPATASATQPAAVSDQAAPTVPNYKIERSDGQVKVSGPGVSIVSTGAPAASTTDRTSGQRNVDPIICEGRRMLHFDNRDIFVDGDAIVARGGCELYITNSRVSASGTGVVVNDAIVHIANSTIEGSAASFDAGDEAKVFVRSSTFEGLPRRSEHALVQDQGGNRWR